MLDLVLTGTYMTCCLTQVHCMISCESISLVTAGTDGHLAFWNLADSLRNQGISIEHGRLQLQTQPGVPSPDTLTSQIHHRVHQSAVKSMVVVRVARNAFLLVTGGDDNALGLTLVHLESHSGPEYSTLLLPKAHASAITAITCLTYSSWETNVSNEWDFATSSNDQRLKLWIVTIDLSKQGVEGLEIRKEGNVCTSVADVSSMDVFSDRSGCQKVLVCGVGMEAWSVDG